MSKPSVPCSVFSVSNGGKRIAGRCYVPAGGSGVPVIISHGFMSSMRETARYAERFAAMGYTAYVFDFLGGAPKNESEGDFESMSVQTEVSDLLAVMDYVAAQHGSKAEKLILCGCSQGGFVSALVAAAHSSRVDKLILFYPALCIPDDARRGQMQFFRFDPKNVPDRVTAFGRLAIGRRYIEDAQSLDALAAIAPYTGDVLLLHGTADKVVPPHYAEDALAVYQARPSGTAQLLRLTGAGHGFKPREDDLAFAVIEQFLAGRREILAVDVRLTKTTFRFEHGMDVRTLAFCGTATGPQFSGEIQPGAADVQKRKWGRPVEFCARYAIKGRDSTGAPCTVRVTNRTTDGTHWQPSLETDSPALAAWNGAEVKAVLEQRRVGPVVHLFM